MEFRYRFGPTEIRELLISWLVLSLIFSIPSGIASFPIILPTLGLAFICHELAHKFVAMSYGFWAEYRMNVSMLIFAAILITLTSIMRTPIVFAAPGAVVIFPISAYGRTATSGENGKIATAGAMANLGLVCVFAVIHLLFPSGIIATICRVGAFINAFLAFFNLLPFGILDGYKVFRWDKKVWFLLIFLSLIAMRIGLS